MTFTPSYQAQQSPEPRWQRGELNPLAQASPPPKLAALIGRHGPAFFDWLSARNDLESAQAALNGASEEQARVDTAAIAAGKPIGARTIVENAQASVVEAERRATATRRHLVDLERQITEAVGRADEWAAQLDTAIVNAEQAADVAVEALAEALDHLDLVRHARVCITDASLRRIGTPVYRAADGAVTEIRRVLDDVARQRERHFGGTDPTAPATTGELMYVFPDDD